MSVAPSVGVAAAPRAVPRTAVGRAVAAERSRLPLVDALRAFASSMIAWHHFALYPPLATGAMPIAGDWIFFLRDHARAAQVFFVVSGYILARSLSQRTWDGQQVGRYILHRYCRLGLPYLAAIVCAISACAWARGWIDESVIGVRPTWVQVLIHTVFLQDILDYDSLSAGLWFVCISFQLALVYVVGLYLRDSIGDSTGTPVRRRLAQVPMLLGWVLALASLFYFNLDDRWDAWAVYFFGQFFLGVLVHEALQNPKSQIALGVYVLMVVAAMAFGWRARLLTTLLTGLALFVGGKTGFTTRWPANRAVAFLGKTSYSLFLIHFPVLVVVATLWVRRGWTSPQAAVLGLVVAYVVSLAASAMFYRCVEAPSARLSRKFT